MEFIPSENQRFKDWLDRQQRTASAVAKDLGVSRAVLSHILSGRNKLSLSVVQCAARAFDDFDLEYVVLGRPGVVKNDSHDPPVKQKPLPQVYDQLIVVRDGKFRVLLPEES
jgi:transcriptional regulator with XRE-family HTH domain